MDFREKGVSVTIIKFFAYIFIKHKVVTDVIILGIEVDLTWRIQTLLTNMI